MPTTDIGVAVIGAGMAGKAHAAAYRSATAVYDSVLPPVRLVTIADVYEPIATATAQRYGFDRADTSWRAVVDDPSINVVSVVVANALHREIVEALLEAGKHVLCEKPLSDTLDDARAMVHAANSAAERGVIARIGLTYRRSPGIAYINQLVQSGRLGKILNVSGAYWTDYGLDPDVPISWRYKGPNGSGALADVGSHLTYLAEFIGGGDFQSVRGGTLSTVIGTRPKPLGAVSGRGRIAVSEEREAVENDDVAAFSGLLEGGATATLQVSRVAAGHPNTLQLEVFGEQGAASFDFRHPGEVRLFLRGDSDEDNGYRTVILGPDQPYWRNGLAMDAQGVGVGQNDGFVFQARAFLDEVAGVETGTALPANADFADGLRNMIVLDAVAQSYQRDGSAVTIGE